MRHVLFVIGMDTRLSKLMEGKDLRPDASKINGKDRDTSSPQTLKTFTLMSLLLSTLSPLRITKIEVCEVYVTASTTERRILFCYSMAGIKCHS